MSVLKMIPLRRSFYSTYSKLISVKEALTSSPLNKNIKIQGWVHSVREQKKYTFIDVNDGSCHKKLQAISSTDLSAGKLSLGTSVILEGTLVASTHPSQPVELSVSSISVLGSCDDHLYPFKARINHPLEYIRQLPHLRARHESFSSILRVRNAASIAVHEYFQSQGYIQVHTPILTSSDCEGAGDLFEVLPASRTNTEEPFFGVPAHLCVSGQLHAETIACGMSKVYTFGPVFRAERSYSRRHLSEFYMVEAETVTDSETCPFENIMKISEDLCKSIVERVLSSNHDDIEFFHSKVSMRKDTKQQLCNMLEKPFKRIAYEEAIDLLLKRKEIFEVQPERGQTLGAEHERYLVEHFDGLPVFVTHFPAAIKPFYAKTDEHNHTQALAMDLLMPGVGEVIGGSVREERFDVLQERLQKLKIDQDYEWYLDLRRFGTMAHGGFGLGFDRFLQVVLGIDNIRDVIPYPRYMNSCQM